MATKNILTPRQLEIAGLIADGKDNNEIATLLELAKDTVKEHIAGCLKRLGFKNRTQLAIWYFKHRLTVGFEQQQVYVVLGSEDTVATRKVSIEGFLFHNLGERNAFAAGLEAMTGYDNYEVFNTREEALKHVSDLQKA